MVVVVGAEGEEEGEDPEEEGGVVVDQEEEVDPEEVGAAMVDYGGLLFPCGRLVSYWEEFVSQPYCVLVASVISGPEIGRRNHLRRRPVNSDKFHLWRKEMFIEYVLPNKINTTFYNKFGRPFYT